jgi:AcrR family transcriptional regulator
VTLEDRRARDRAARHQLIISTARLLAEAEGWDAVTTRRLSTEIEHSRPVLYKHFRVCKTLSQPSQSRDSPN